MFYITDYNKISLTKGDTASFNCVITDIEGKARKPLVNDVLTLSIDDTDFEVTATNNIDYYTFSIGSADTEDVKEGVYTYRVILETGEGERYTIFQDCLFDLLGDKPEGENDEP